MAGRNRGLGGENVYFLRITTRKHGRVQESCDSLGSIVGDASEGLSLERVGLAKKSFLLIVSHSRFMGVGTTKYPLEG